MPRTPADRARALRAGFQVHVAKPLDARQLAADHGDAGTNDLLVSSVLHTNELQVWFLAEHLVDVPVVRG